MHVKQRTMLKKAQSGDVDAFLALIEPVERKVYTVAYGLTHSQIEAEQVAADAIIALFAKFGTYQGEGSVAKWMIRTAVSEVLRLVRERRAAKVS